MAVGRARERELDPATVGARELDPGRRVRVRSVRDPAGGLVGLQPPYWLQRRGACLHFSSNFSTMDEAFLLF
jgi:hypothetical protein